MFTFVEVIYHNNPNAADWCKFTTDFMSEILPYRIIDTVKSFSIKLKTSYRSRSAAHCLGDALLGAVKLEQAPYRYILNYVILVYYAIRETLEYYEVQHAD